MGKLDGNHRPLMRRTKHKLCMFYRKSNALSPPYLSSLVPSSFENISYNLPDSQNIRLVLTRPQLFYRAFLPSSIKNGINCKKKVREKSRVVTNQRKKQQLFFNGITANI